MQNFLQNSKPGQLSKSTSYNTQINENNGDCSEILSDYTTKMTRCNSVQIHREKNMRQLKMNNDGKKDDSKIPLMPMQEKLSELYRSRKISDSSTIIKDSVSNLTENNTKVRVPAANKWNKLRAVMTMTTALKSKKPLERQDSFIKKFTTQRYGNDEENSQEESHQVDIDNVEILRTKLLHKLIIDPKSRAMCIWLGIVTLAVIYNLWTCIARQAFSDILIGSEVIWIILDISADIIYILDIGVQLRTTYLERGLCVFNSRKLAKRYISSRNFNIDLISLLPLDFSQFFIGFHPLVRFPRFLKVYRAWKWKIIVENRTIFPNLWRVVNLTHILFLGCHWFASFYFMISQAGGFQSSWGYPKPVGDFSFVTRKYLKSFYWSTLTLTTIGDLAAPERNWEYIFTIVSYLIGVFVFATIVGQVGNVITNRNANRLEFEKILDNSKNFMRLHNVPSDLQRRVMRWYDYAWSRGRTSGCSDISSLALLPDKLKTEMALHVNLETLKKVTIFQECRPEFLHDLVLKMRPFIFTPGDLICRKGEVAREMFIISDGVLEVISDSGDVLKKMGSGDFFGEIGILNLDCGINRRTADVKSVGYSELFVLSKEDVLDALKDHPDAQELIVRYGTSRLNEMKDRRCQRNSKRIPVLSSGNSSNLSIEKSLHSGEIHMEQAEQAKQAELQSMSVFKNLFQKIKLNKQSASNAVCTHGNQQQSLDNKSCDNCALAKLANKITRESVTITPFFSKQTKPHSRLNSVPSIFCQSDNGFNQPYWADPTQLVLPNLTWKESLMIPKCNRTRKRSHSTLPNRSTGDISEETVAVDDNFDSIKAISNQSELDATIIRNDPTLVKDIEHSTRRESTSNLSHESSNASDCFTFANYDHISNSKLYTLSKSEMKIITTTLETILSSQTNRVVANLQAELRRTQKICSNQQNEIDRLKDEIRKLSSGPSIA